MHQAHAEQSLVHVLESRRDTVFRGRQISEPEGEFHEDAFEDENGDYYSHRHDHIGVKCIDGTRVGILVADEDGKNAMDHSYSGLPHLMGLFVRESHRGKGIATELVTEFMQSVDDDTCVVDCESTVAPLYMQLDWDIIYLGRVKQGNDPTKPPLIEIDRSETPEHGLPVLAADSEEEAEYVSQCEQAGDPAVYISIDGSVSEGRVPSSHKLAGEDPIQRYVSRKSEHEVLRVVINQGHLDQNITLEGMELLQQLPAKHDDSYENTGRWAWIQRRDNAETIETQSVSPSAVKEIADAVYAIVSDKSNTGPDGAGITICR